MAIETVGDIMTELPPIDAPLAEPDFAAAPSPAPGRQTENPLILSWGVYPAEAIPIEDYMSARDELARAHAVPA